jgi:hypothetical protein
MNCPDLPLSEIAGQADARNSADPVAVVNSLGAIWSDDFDAYASGELDISQVTCCRCTCRPCRCPAFGTPEYLALVDFRHGRKR